LRKDAAARNRAGAFLCAPQKTITVADALLIEWAAPSIGLASLVLQQQRIAGAPGLAKVSIGVKKVFCNAKNTYSLCNRISSLKSQFSKNLD
jgi:hypothetical protein